MPFNINDLVGNKKVINDFMIWLQDWNDVIIDGNKKEINFKKGNF
jgi:hypothetical protein